MLFTIAGISFKPDNNFWNNIIDNAHKNVARVSQTEFIEKIAAISPTIEVLGKYISNHEKIKVRCCSCYCRGVDR